MYLGTFDALGKREHFKVFFIAKDGCPAPLADYLTNNGGTLGNSSWTACTKFHAFEIGTLKQMRPHVIVVSSNSELDLANPNHAAGPKEVQTDMAHFLSKLPASSKVIVLGGFPQPAPNANPTLCLTRHPSHISSCAFAPSSVTTSDNTAFARAARSNGDVFLNQTPWFCTHTCPAIIGKYIPYTSDAYHADYTYLQFLMGIIWVSLAHYVN
jgi:hypothetical protein